MNLKNRIVALVTATAIAFPAIALAKHTMKAGKERVPMAFFKAKLNAGAVIDAKTADVTVNDDDNNIVIKVDLHRVDTGMGMRNEHFQTKFLKKKKEDKSEAVLTVKKADIKGKDSGKVKGKLKLNDKEKEVSVNFTTKKKDDVLKVEGDTKIKYTDFGWEKMCYMGVCVEEEVSLSAVLFVSPD